MVDRPSLQRRVAVFGATGLLGRYVVSELARRGFTPIAVARSLAALAAARFWGADVPRRRQARVDDAASLDRALDGAEVVVNCAGPFADTAEAVTGAALRAGIHSIDMSLEQSVAHTLLSQFGPPAHEVGVVVVPSMAFHGGLADLMVSATIGDWQAVDSIEVIVGLEPWASTAAARSAIERSAASRLVIHHGRLTPLSRAIVHRRWNFGAPFEDEAVAEVPFSEILLIAHHIQTHELHSYLNAVATRELLNLATPIPMAMGHAGGSQQRFVMQVVIRKGKQRRRSVTRGRDIYGLSAALAAEAVRRLTEGRFTRVGAVAPGELFEACGMLASLPSAHARFDLLSTGAPCLQPPDRCAAR